MAVVTMRQMLESGVHFGHQTRRWNPKMKRFILTERNGIYIIDLTQSLTSIDRAYSYVKETVSRGGTIMFVGTKKQAQEAVAEQASRVGMPYVNERWLGGMLTNFQTVHKRLQRLKELEQLDFDDVASSGMTKKELLVLRREKDKLERTLGGIRDMNKVPSAVWIVDTNKEHIAVGEARKLGIPVIAILDSNCDPDVVDFPIPGNDDAIRAVGLLTRVIADAVAEGLMERASGGTASGTAEPLAEWEAELLAAHAAEAAAGAAADAAVAEAVVAEEVAEEAAVEAVVADAVAEEAVVEAVVAEAVAEEAVAEAEAGEVPVEVAEAAVEVAVVEEAIAEEAVIEAVEAEAVAEEAVAEAVVAEAVAEEAAEEAVVAEAEAIEAEAEVAAEVVDAEVADAEKASE
jgi:small subunit ribosomal protein S2